MGEGSQFEEVSRKENRMKIALRSDFKLEDKRFGICYNILWELSDEQGWSDRLLEVKR